jgi:hypothetical protein
MLRRITFGFVALVSACATFEGVEGDRCGNHVIDEDEDCDSFDLAGSICAAPGEPNQCRLLCDPAAVPSGCPGTGGWACGGDGVCRQPTATFAPPTDVAIAESTGLILPADFDGDGATDLLTNSIDSLQAIDPAFAPGGMTRVHFFGDSGVEASALLAFNYTTSTAVGDLSGDGLPDVVIGTGGLGASNGSAISIYRSGEDRSLSPQAYASQPLPSSGVHVWAQEVAVSSSTVTSGEEPMALFDMGSFTGVFYVVDPSIDPIPIASGLPTFEKLRGDIGVGQLRDGDDSPCDEFALVFADEVIVGTPCTGPANMPLNAIGAPGYVEPTHVDLPPGRTATRVFLRDLDGDAHLDLVIGAALVDGGHELLVAYGRGDMTFDSALDADLLLPPDNDAATLMLLYTDELFEFGEPLALGDLDDDGEFDLVTSQYILTTGHALPGSPFQAAFNLGGVREAFIGDFNGTGAADVVASLDSALILDFYGGAGDGLFNYVSVFTGAPVKDIEVGDFDGDIVPDVALALGSLGGEASDALAVSFGRAGAAPDSPVTIGRLGTIVQIATGRFYNPATTLADGISEIAAVSSTESGGETLQSLAILYGSQDRQLQAPYSLFARAPGGEVSAVHAPQRLAVAELGGDLAHLDLAVLGQGSDQDTSILEPFRRLWIVESRGDAELSETTTFESEYLTTERESSCEPLIAAVDADGDGDDEVVYFTAYADSDDFYGTTTGLFLVAEAQGEEADRALVEVHRESVPESFRARAPRECFTFNPTTLDSYVLPPGEQRVVAEDLDGDGLRDLAVFGYVSPEPMDIFDESYVVERHVMVFWNQGTGDAATAFSVSARSDVVDAGAVTAIGSIAADNDAARELVLLREDGVFLVDTQGRELGAPERVPNAPGGTAVVGADMTRDGLEDLVIGTPVGVLVLAQRAENP